MLVDIRSTTKVRYHQQESCRTLGIRPEWMPVMKHKFKSKDLLRHGERT